MEAVWEWICNAREFLGEVNTITMIIRIAMAAIAGALIGLERELHGRAAGLRTHMLVALGATLSALIGVYLSVVLGVSSDVQRTGAQVMSGVGFLGAGTILVKKGNSRISGLTTAAGLWATAAMGLAMGYGLYEAALVAVLIVILAYTMIGRLEFFMNRKRQRIFVYLEIDDVRYVTVLSEKLETDYAGIEIQVTPPRSGCPPHVGMEALIRIPHKVSVEEKVRRLNKLDHVVFALKIT